RIVWNRKLGSLLIEDFLHADGQERWHQRRHGRDGPQRETCETQRPKGNAIVRALQNRGQFGIAPNERQRTPAQGERVGGLALSVAALRTQVRKNAASNLLFAAGLLHLRARNAH